MELTGEWKCAADSGNTAWVLMSTILVLGMMPALAFFESGLLRAKNTLSILTQILSGLPVLGVMWHVIGFGLVYGHDVGGVIGNPSHFAFYRLLRNYECMEQAPTVPSMAFATFQMMFAAITPLLMTGCFAGRLRFRAFLVFIILWEFLVYYPLAHWIWGNGWLAKIGVIDFAGGIVIHASAGAASIVVALVLGKRSGFEEHHGEVPPSNVPLATVGAALLWMGWYGFNAGSAYSSGTLASLVVTNTTIASCVSCVSWIVLSLFHCSHLNTVSVMNGAIAGLAGITPVSGYIESYYATPIAVLIGFSSFYSIVILKEKLKIDDALDVSSVHGVPGIVGALAIGIFATKEVNPNGKNGWVAGHPVQIPIQLLGIAVAMVWAALFSLIIIWFVKLVHLQNITAEQEYWGLDIVEHGEDPAYSTTHPMYFLETDEHQILGRLVTQHDIPSRSPTLALVQPDMAEEALSINECEHRYYTEETHKRDEWTNNKSKDKEKRVSQDKQSKRQETQQDRDKAEGGDEVKEKEKENDTNTIPTPTPSIPTPPNNTKHPPTFPVPTSGYTQTDTPHTTGYTQISSPPTPPSGYTQISAPLTGYTQISTPTPPPGYTQISTPPTTGSGYTPISTVQSTGKTQTNSRVPRPGFSALHSSLPLRFDSTQATSHAPKPPPTTHNSTATNNAPRLKRRTSSLWS